MRKYDSPVRREQAARTRQRIVDAGADLVRELPTWDWRGLTYTAVAARAKVGMRTVYRYFPTARLNVTGHHHAAEAARVLHSSATELLAIGVI